MLHLSTQALLAKISVGEDVERDAVLGAIYIVKIVQLMMDVSLN